MNAIAVVGRFPDDDTDDVDDYRQGMVWQQNLEEYILINCASSIILKEIMDDIVLSLSWLLIISLIFVHQIQQS